MISARAKYIAIITLLVVAIIAPAHAEEILLEKRLVMMPGWSHSVNGDVGLFSGYWHGGHFFVTSMMCGAALPGFHGLWVFDEAGNLLGERDVCVDSGVPDAWQHTWGTNPGITFVDDNTFVKEMGQNVRPPIYYAIRNGRVEQISRAWDPGEDFSASSGPGKYVIERIAYANGYLVGAQAPAFRDGAYGVMTYRLPGFNFHKKVLDRGYPLMGIGDFVFITGMDSKYATNIYRVTDSGDLQLVKTAYERRIPLFTVDAMDNNRLLAYVNALQPVDGQPAKPAQLDVWELRNNELVLVSSRANPPMFHSVNSIMSHSIGSFAAAGNYTLVPNKCNRFSELCGFELWKGDTMVASKKLPPWEDSVGQARTDSGVPALALSPSGKIIAVEFAQAVLYRVNGFDGLPGATTRIVTTPAFSVPSGYAAPSAANVTRLTAFGGGNTMTVTAIGDFIHKTGYILKNGQWESFMFEGAGNGSWKQNQASKNFNIPEIPQQGFVIAYVCNKVGNALDCDPAVNNQTSKWRIRYYEIVTTGGNGSNNTNPPPEEVPTCTQGNECNPNAPYDSCASTSGLRYCYLDLDTGCYKWQSQSCPSNAPYCRDGGCMLHPSEWTRHCTENGGTCRLTSLKNGRTVQVGSTPLCFFDPSTPGLVYYLEKGCWKCADGYTYDAGRDECVSSGGPSQNLRIKDIKLQTIDNREYVSVEICRDSSSAMSGLMTVVFSADKSTDWSPLEIDNNNVPLCSAAQGLLNWGTEYDRLFNNPAPGTTHQVTVTATFPSQHNGITSDDTMTKTVTLRGSSGGGGTQNLKVVDINASSGAVNAILCKTQNTPVSGSATLTMVGDSTRTTSVALDTITVCGSGSAIGYGFTYSFLFNNAAAGSTHTVTASMQWPSQYNSVTSDDAMTKTVTLGGNGGGGQQNLKIVDIVARFGGVNAIVCKTQNTPVSGTVTITMVGDNTRTRTESIDLVPLCGSSEFGWGFTYPFLFSNSAVGSSHSVTATMQWPSQHNSATNDDSMTKTVTLG